MSIAFSFFFFEEIKSEFHKPFFCFLPPLIHYHVPNLENLVFFSLNRFESSDSKTRRIFQINKVLKCMILFLSPPKNTHTHTLTWEINVKLFQSNAKETKLCQAIILNIKYINKYRSPSLHRSRCVSLYLRIYLRSILCIIVMHIWRVKRANQMNGMS